MLACMLDKVRACNSLPWKMARTSFACHYRCHFDGVKYFSVEVKPPAPPWSGDERPKRNSSRNEFDGPPRRQRKDADVDQVQESQGTRHFSPRKNSHGGPAVSKFRGNGKRPSPPDRGNASDFKSLREDDFAMESKMPQKKRFSFEKTEGSEILFGVAPCHLALSQSRRNFLNLLLKSTLKPQRPEIQEACVQAEARGIPVQHVTRYVLDSLCKSRVHQGMCLEVTPLRYESFDEEAEGLLAEDPDCLKKQLLWIVLEGIQDPMNMGAILRTAYFLGVDKVIASQTNSCPLTPVVSKASAGTMELLEVFGANDIHGLLQAKLQQGWQIVGTVGKSETPADVPIITTSEFQWRKPTVVVLGNEGHGLSAEIKSLCQMMLTIPSGRILQPGIESLNVSVAAGIILHSLCSKRT